jgi:hypothetical protein
MFIIDALKNFNGQKMSNFYLAFYIHIYLAITCVPDVTMTYIRRWMQMVYCHMIYSFETEQNKTTRYSDTVSWIVGNIHLQMVTIYSIYVLCARWVLLVTPDSSSHPPCCPMGLLPHGTVASSSAGDQLLISFPAWRAGPSPIPPTQVDPISLRLQASSRFSIGHNLELAFEFQ